MKVESILFGAAYYDEYMPYDRINTDFQMMKDAGLNVIRIAESTWSTWEPKDNVFDFTHLHRMLDAAVKYDIKVIVGTPTYAVPAWLVKKHPKILAVTKDGPALYGHRQLTDLRNPDYRFHAERMIRRLMEEVHDHPQIIGYQLDNETKAAGAASMETQALFLAELQKKYPDIDTLNQEFGLDYWSNRIADWEDFPDVRGTINGSLSAAYKRFLRDTITDFLHWQAKILREYIRDDQFITHNFDFSWIGYSFGIQPEVNQAEAAKCMEVAGVDIYHPSQEYLTGATIAFGGAVGRSLKKENYLVLETEAQGRSEWLPYPGQLRLQAYSHLANGSNSVMYWHWHSLHNAIESYWKGILSHDLLPNATYRELAAWRKEMLPIESHLKNLQKQCPVAILADNSSLTGLDEFPISESLDYNHILRWMHDCCYELNLECDLVYAGDDFSNYKLLLVPALYSATEETIQKLDRFIQDGGQLLMGFRSIVSDDELKIYADALPHHMTERLGASYDQFTKPSGTTLSLDGISYKVSEWMELLRPTDGEVWAKYQHPFWGSYTAIVHKQTGLGGMTYLGCYVEKDGLKALLKRLAKMADISLFQHEAPLIRRTGINDYGKRITYLLNYSSAPQMLYYEGEPATDLLTQKKYSPGTNIPLAPWGLVILEE